MCKIFMGVLLVVIKECLGTDKLKHSEKYFCKSLIDCIVVGWYHCLYTCTKSYQLSKFTNVCLEIVCL